MSSPVDSKLLRHSLYIGGSIREFIALYNNGAKSAASMIHSLQEILDPLDISFLVLFIVLAKPMLHVAYKASTSLQAVQNRKEYKDSIFGYLEQPLCSHARCLPTLYVFDILGIVFKALGFGLTDIQVDKIHWDFFVVFHHIFTTYVWGNYATKMKDYLMQQRYRLKVSKEGKVNNSDARESTIDELTSLGIWIFAALGCLESLSRTFGFGIGSVFALGGRLLLIGLITGLSRKSRLFIVYMYHISVGVSTASIVFALRSTFENLAGGILVKLQDKFRVGDKISILKGEEGKVVDIHYLWTHIRRSDDSIVTTPNHVFVNSEVVNWSRTPFRKFSTMATIPLNNVHLLARIISNIKEELTKLPQLDTRYHDLIVAATTFDTANGCSIGVKVEAHFQASNEREASLLHTEAISIIATACNTEQR